MNAIVKSNILKLALFATGLAGIVAEYTLSTLAFYFLGDSAFQWAMIISVMLFSMGMGSRISQYFRDNLLLKFILIEFLLSFLSSFSSLFTYTGAAYFSYVGFIIYGLSIVIGLLIGMEIPLVIRLNDSFEELRMNVSSVLEKDYWGSLVGGIFFAFVGLPILGLTYTPFLLGGINLLVALLILRMLWGHLTIGYKWQCGLIASFLVGLLITGAVFAKPIVLHGEQKRYKDKVVYTEQTRYQRIVITQWKDDYWLFLNGNEQLSSLDEVMYHEPLVHPVMSLLQQPKNVLVLGGGDGCAVREILKYPSVEEIDLVDLDPAMTNLGQTNDILLSLNKGSLNNPKVKIVNEDAYHFLEQTKNYYDAIIIDLPDPKTVELSRMYSVEFYELCRQQLRPHGKIITQAGSPYYATEAFKCIEKSMQFAGFSTVPLHNQVLTLGEWGWILGSKSGGATALKSRLQKLSIENVPTQWINQEAMLLMTSFGKNIYPKAFDSVSVNRVHDPVLHRYYRNGNWDLY
ncbi:polyamine aminopropyltransferase [Xanthovirga aplysinae]|uniref:polyamine aminopropyltransferase n=1 Tax=Xanthovirga aplysinae TaxID=2529853 RepID=UPI0012BB9442|nr:polyamine aminopropyltransferase [Xanthovirga aplysinae]MTI32314.1 polyamine aminopropyltransferase [Xanthovirga aplysinae]